MPRIAFNDFTVGKLSNCSGIFTGENVQYKQTSSRKINEGFGTVSSSKNTITNNRQTVKSLPRRSKP